MHVHRSVNNGFNHQQTPQLLILHRSVMSLLTLVARLWERLSSLLCHFSSFFGAGWMGQWETLLMSFADSLLESEKLLCSNYLHLLK